MELDVDCMLKQSHLRDPVDYMRAEILRIAIEGLRQFIVRERFLTHKPSHVCAKTRLGERMRSGRPACCAAKATMRVAV